MSLKSISQEETSLLKDKITIKARPLNKTILTINTIEENDLLPKYKLESLNRMIYISRPYLMDKRKEVAFIGYVEDTENIVARTFFYSRSQGVARLLRRYKFKEVEDENGNLTEKPTWNDKGFDEESLLLPVELQRALAEIAKEEPVTFDNSDFIFYGTAYDLTNKNDDYITELNNEPLLLDGNFYSDEMYMLIVPEDLVFDSIEQKPDFSKIIDEWELDFTYYGKTNAKVFMSNNRKLKYIFYTDENKRSWIAGIDNTSEITSLGLRKNWVKAGNLSIPPWEYLTGEVDSIGKYKIDQTGGFGDETNRKDYYVDMYKNYLSKFPIIKEFKKLY